MTSFLTCPHLDNLPFLRHAFFTRNLEGSTHNYLIKEYRATKEEALNNRHIAMQQLGVARDKLCLVKQEHTNQVVVVERNWPLEETPVADAMVTNVPGLVLGVLTADCTPVLFVDPEASIIGAAHAGWKGAKGGVVENTLQAMTGLGAELSRIVVAIGPCIQQYSYETGPEFYENFLQESPDNKRFFAPSEKTGHHMFDMSAYVTMRAQAAGVINITNLKRDTCSDEEHFFSYRRCCQRGEKYHQNSLSVIGIKE